MYVYTSSCLSLSPSLSVSSLSFSLSRSFLLSPLIHRWLAQYDSSACYFSRIIRACFACSLCAAQGMADVLKEPAGSSPSHYRAPGSSSVAGSPICVHSEEPAFSHTLASPSRWHPPLASLHLSLSLSLCTRALSSPTLHFKRTNVSCSHRGSALVFCTEFSPRARLYLLSAPSHSTHPI